MSAVAPRLSILPSRLLGLIHLSDCYTARAD
jgi:hypothetical protein